MLGIYIKIPVFNAVTAQRGRGFAEGEAGRLPDSGIATAGSVHVSPVDEIRHPLILQVKTAKLG